MLLAADASDNCMGRVRLLADMLSAYAEVHIIGIASKDAIWPPLAGDSTYPLTIIPGSLANPFSAAYMLQRILRRHPGNLIYICKPKLHTMLAGLFSGKNCALDIDDWESQAARVHPCGSSLTKALASRGISFTKLAEFLIPFVQNRTVSNPFLQRRYGGHLIPHARKMLTASSDLSTLRDYFNLPKNTPIVLFFGTPHRHKGVLQLIDALALARHRNLHLVIAGLPVGGSEHAEYTQAAEEKLCERVSFLSFIQWQDKEKLLQCADIIAVPQTRNAFTLVGQTPAKVFDALAAAKPLIVSDLSDMRDITQGHAWLVEPDSPQSIATALDEICDHPQASKERALQAQQYFQSHFSEEVIAPKLARALGVTPEL